jgi:hypothetical protein
MRWFLMCVRDRSEEAIEGSFCESSELAAAEQCVMVAASVLHGYF